MENVTIKNFSKDERLESYKKALDKWGNLQLVVAAEELSELQKEICKSMRGKRNIENLIEEITDVEICLEQLKMIFSISDEEIRREKDYKISRLNNSLEEEIKM